MSATLFNKLVLFWVLELQSTNKAECLPSWNYSAMEKNFGYMNSYETRCYSHM